MDPELQAMLDEHCKTCSECDLSGDLPAYCDVALDAIIVALGGEGDE